uniref:LIM zinc-binding domain-containing protein n=1 Tax=Caenorhabditis tropicalis TaxID=1561998 RepID=A0A1I7TZQ9_9PELO
MVTCPFCGAKVQPEQFVPANEQDFNLKRFKCSSCKKALIGITFASPGTMVPKCSNTLDKMGDYNNKKPDAA